MRIKPSYYTFGKRNTYVLKSDLKPQSSDYCNIFHSDIFISNNKSLSCDKINKVSQPSFSANKIYSRQQDFRTSTYFRLLKDILDEKELEYGSNFTLPLKLLYSGNNQSFELHKILNDKQNIEYKLVINDGKNKQELLLDDDAIKSEHLIKNNTNLNTQVSFALKQIYNANKTQFLVSYLKTNDGLATFKKSLNTHVNNLTDDFTQLKDITSNYVSKLDDDKDKLLEIQDRMFKQAESHEVYNHALSVYKYGIGEPRKLWNTFRFKAFNNARQTLQDFFNDDVAKAKSWINTEYDEFLNIHNNRNKELYGERLQFSKLITNTSNINEIEKLSSKKILASEPLDFQTKTYFNRVQNLFEKQNDRFNGDSSTIELSSLTPGIEFKLIRRDEKSKTTYHMLVVTQDGINQIDINNDGLVANFNPEKSSLNEYVTTGLELQLENNAILNTLSNDILNNRKNCVDEFNTVLRDYKKDLMSLKDNVYSELIKSNTINKHIDSISELLYRSRIRLDDSNLYCWILTGYSNER